MKYLDDPSQLVFDGEAPPEYKLEEGKEIQTMPEGIRIASLIGESGKLTDLASSAGTGRELRDAVGALLKRQTGLAVIEILTSALYGVGQAYRQSLAHMSEADFRQMALDLGLDYKEP